MTDDTSPDRRHRQEGYALVAVILGLGLLTLIASIFSNVMQTHVRAAANASISAQAAALADGGVQVAIWHLLKRGVQDVPATANPSELLISCSTADGAKIAVRLEDEAGKIDLNFVDDRLLLALLRGLGLSDQAAQETADRIVDFRDTDNLKRPRGAEAAEYSAAQLGYPPKNAPFETPDELQQVLGMSEALARELSDITTVSSRRSGIDPHLAPTRLLRLLAKGLRASSNGAAASDTEVAAVTSHIIQEHFAPTSSTAFRILSEARVGGARFIREAIVELQRPPAPSHVIRRWRRASSDADVGTAWGESCPF